MPADRGKVPKVVTLKSGQQNASSVDAKSPMHSFELRTSSTLPRCSRVTSNPGGKPQNRYLGFAAQRRDYALSSPPV